MISDLQFSFGLNPSTGLPGNSIEVRAVSVTVTSASANWISRIAPGTQNWCPSVQGLKLLAGARSNAVPVGASAGVVALIGGMTDITKGKSCNDVLAGKLVGIQANAILLLTARNVSSTAS